MLTNFFENDIFTSISIVKARINNITLKFSLIWTSTDNVHFIMVCKVNCKVWDTVHQQTKDRRDRLKCKFEEMGENRMEHCVLDFHRKRRIMAAHRYFHGLQRHLRSKILSQVCHLIRFILKKNLFLHQLFFFPKLPFLICCRSEGSSVKNIEKNLSY